MDKSFQLAVIVYSDAVPVFHNTDQHLNEVEEGREPIYRFWSGSVVLSSGKEASYTGTGVQDFSAECG